MNSQKCVLKTLIIWLCTDFNFTGEVVDEPNSSVFWIVLFLLGCLLFFMKTGCPFLETEGQNFWSFFYAEYKEIGIAILSSSWAIGIYFHNIQVTIVHKNYFLVVIDLLKHLLLSKEYKWRFHASKNQDVYLKKKNKTKPLKIAVALPRFCLLYWAWALTSRLSVWLRSHLLLRRLKTWLGNS